MTAEARTSHATGLAAAAARSRAYRDAEALLQQLSPLRPDQFANLDELFRQISGAELKTLTQHPQYCAQLRRYETLSWQRRRVGIGLLLLALAVIAGLAAATC